MVTGTTGTSIRQLDLHLQQSYDPQTKLWSDLPAFFRQFREQCLAEMVYNLLQQNNDEAAAWEQVHNVLTHAHHENGTFTLDSIHNSIKMAEESLIMCQQRAQAVQQQACTATANSAAIKAAATAPLVKSVEEQLAEIKTLLQSAPMTASTTQPMESVSARPLIHARKAARTGRMAGPPHTHTPSAPSATVTTRAERLAASRGVI
jgi:hypothetical protein